MFFWSCWLSLAIAQPQPELSAPEVLPRDASADLAALSERSTGPGSDARGEYNRLSEEMETLVSKNAWVGVERTFQQLVATGVPLTFEDWVRGADAARAVGDVAAVRQRLLSALALREDRRVLDWLWDLDQRYGAVLLQCDRGAQLVLEPQVAALDPDVRRAIALARQRVHDACYFQGLLPVGSYTLHETSFEVQPGRAVLTIDLRGLRLDRETRRRLKAFWGQP